MGDELLGLRIELEDIRRQMIVVSTTLDGLRARVGIVGYRLGEMAAVERVATQTIPSGLPCTADVVWDETQPAEPVDSSAAIPESVVEHIARCGE
jgi:hypothetical protein